MMPKTPPIRVKDEISPALCRRDKPFSASASALALGLAFIRSPAAIAQRTAPTEPLSLSWGSSAHTAATSGTARRWLWHAHLVSRVRTNAPTATRCGAFHAPYQLVMYRPLVGLWLWHLQGGRQFFLATPVTAERSEEPGRHQSTGGVGTRSLFLGGIS
jgi:hypothetical protein